MISKERSDQTFGGIILIGIAFLFLTNWFFPGILFVIGFALIARSVSEGKNWTENKGALAAIAVGLLFTLNDVLDIFSSNFLPLLLIVLGLYLLFGSNLRKNEEKQKHDVV